MNITMNITRDHIAKLKAKNKAGLLLTVTNGMRQHNEEQGSWTHEEQSEANYPVVTANIC